jgi:hypothetical protein
MDGSIYDCGVRLSAFNPDIAIPNIMLQFHIQMTVIWDEYRFSAGNNFPAPINLNCSKKCACE